VIGVGRHAWPVRITLVLERLKTFLEILTLHHSDAQRRSYVHGLIPLFAARAMIVLKTSLNRRLTFL
jgi:hypothetical protein